MTPRTIWIASPDTEVIRQKLLDLLKNIKEKPGEEYPAGFYLDEIIIWQLGQFKEKRAIPDLERIAKLDPSVSSDDSIGRLRSNEVELAKQVLEEIQQNQSE